MCIKEKFFKKHEHVDSNITRLWEKSHAHICCGNSVQPVWVDI